QHLRVRRAQPRAARDQPVRRARLRPGDGLLVAARGALDGVGARAASRVSRGGARAVVARDLPARDLLGGGRGAVLPRRHAAGARASAVEHPVRAHARARAVAIFAVDDHVVHHGARHGPHVHEARKPGSADRRALHDQPPQPQLHRKARAARVKRIALAALLVAASGVSADELSGADKLRVVYSNQFSWTRDGLPIVTVRVMEHRPSVTLSAEGMRVVPDGEGGPEVKGGATWTVRIVDGKPGRVVTHNVVASFAPLDTEALQAELATWRAKKIATRTFETGALFAVKGQVLDSRKILVAAAGTTGGTPFPELVDRPRGTVEAVDERGVVVRNDSILWFEPGPAGTIALADVDNERGGKETRRYFGKIYVTVDNAGQLAVVNAVPEDKLLAGLVPAEMSASSPPEALKAQAVAARNALLAKIGTRHLTDPYRLCSTVHCQVYAGAGREDARATAAVQATRGELLERDGGGLVDAVYSASCGGHGENNEYVWGGSPDAALRGKLDGDAAL